ncbi:hypothetical protein BX666DRAFT_640961 [Dichotomocladium elegans]|nr:hypothetical protein BX666DRAFT_640961 [Dichotomocladium elegans]
MREQFLLFFFVGLVNKKGEEEITPLAAGAAGAAAGACCCRHSAALHFLASSLLFLFLFFLPSFCVFMMPSFFGLKRLSASDIFFRRKKDPSSRHPQPAKQKRSLSVSDEPHHRPSIDYHSRVYDHELATKFGDNVMVNDLELLLSMETQLQQESSSGRWRHWGRRNSSISSSSSSSRRRRSSDGGGIAQRRQSSVGSPNSSQTSFSSQERKPHPRPEIGLSSRVQLIRRPLPTYGTVRFIGSVDFAPGAEWIGVELDSRGKEKKSRTVPTDTHPPVPYF